MENKPKEDPYKFTGADAVITAIGSAIAILCEKPGKTLSNKVGTGLLAGAEMVGFIYAFKWLKNTLFTAEPEVKPTEKDLRAIAKEALAQSPEYAALKERTKEKATWREDAVQAKAQKGSAIGLQ